jgi:dihydroorotase
MSKRSILIQGGKVFDPSQGIRGEERDVLIVDGKIETLEIPGNLTSGNADETILAQNQWVFPGLIDMHVHLREPGLEYKETIASGTLAAVAGGFTSVACMANTLPVNDTAIITAFIKARAKENGHCRVFPIGAVTEGLNGEALSEIGGMVEEGAVAISDDGMPVMNSLVMRRAMEYAKNFQIPVISHAEDYHLAQGGIINEGKMSLELGLPGNPSAAEEILVAREIALCRLTGCSVHIAHVSSKLAVDLIRRAKAEGLPITAEVTPHHLILTDAAVKGYNTYCKMAPPLRSEEDRMAVLEALADGTIDVIATDHAPHAEVDKNQEFEKAPNGIIGIQTALSKTFELVQKEHLSPMRWIESLTQKPAEILNLPHGSLKKGMAADFALFDPQALWNYEERTNLSKSLNSPHLGEKLQGLVTSTWIEGRRVYEQGK